MSPSSHSVVEPGRRLSRAVGYGALLGAGLAILILVLAVALLRDRTPKLTQADLNEARKHWTQNAPASYRLELQKEGTRAGQVTLTVENGKAVRCTIDGRIPSQRRTWKYWTVEGQFGMIQRELYAAENPDLLGAPKEVEVNLKARFDDHYGFPRRFQRNAMGADLDMGWTVTKFEPLAD